MLTNTYECLAIILRSLRLVANCIRKPIRFIFATFWRICREYICLHSQGYSPQCESSITTANKLHTENDIHWIRGHCDIHRNDRADLLAKQRTTMTQHDGPVYCIESKQIIKTKSRKSLHDRWARGNTGRQ